LIPAAPLVCAGGSAELVVVVTFRGMLVFKLALAVDVGVGAGAVTKEINEANDVARLSASASTLLMTSVGIAVSSVLSHPGV